MKVMWILDFLSPAFARRLGLSAQASGSWAGSLQAALPAGAMDLTICCFSPALTAPCHEEIDGTRYIGLPAADRAALAETLAVQQPDLIQLFGTENDHAPWVLDCSTRRRCWCTSRAWPGLAASTWPTACRPVFCAASR